MMLCSRCLAIIDMADANFCPRCGNSLKSLRTYTPTFDEFQAFESRVAELLPRLTKMHDWLNQCRDEATVSGSTAALDLSQKRLLLLERVERRLEEHLRVARRRLYGT